MKELIEGNLPDLFEEPEEPTPPQPRGKIRECLDLLDVRWNDFKKQRMASNERGGEDIDVYDSR